MTRTVVSCRGSGPARGPSGGAAQGVHRHQDGDQVVREQDAVQHGIDFEPPRLNDLAHAAALG
ncbi:hypothetical protein [uncultured Thiohalocapsa sp.]|uniref:hypothetical protein n=1 Tax=uncultured Thiohalocapsa sp. TaxID=768990 RepID=UPI0025E0256A|nr:hypothetical protein [uncultured Thiohalocapsa sp.]